MKNKINGKNKRGSLTTSTKTFSLFQKKDKSQRELSPVSIRVGFYLQLLLPKHKKYHLTHRNLSHLSIQLYIFGLSTLKQRHLYYSYLILQDITNAIYKTNNIYLLKNVH